jgi:hypothetical protein
MPKNTPLKPTSPKPKQTRKHPEFAQFEIEQHQQANKAMSFIHAPC